MSKKFDFLFRQYCMVLHITPDSDEVWFSSAQNLDDELKKRNIVLKRPLFRKYNLPDGVSQQDYLVKKNSLNTIGRYEAGDMARFVACLSDGVALKDEYMKLSSDEKIAFDKYLVDLAAQENHKIDAECKKIRALNPELVDLDVANDIEFLSGVVYGFPPEDIKFFADVRKKKLDWRQEKAQYADQDLLSQQLGVSIGYRLSPDTMNAIRVAMKNNGRE